MNDMDFNLVRPQPTCEPEAVASGFIRDDNALDAASAFHRLVPPALKEP
jgi:hypothetical protein